MDIKAACYLEGVPVKISEKYRPPPKVSLPASLASGQPNLQNIFADQYDFSLELATLRRIQAWTAERVKSQRRREELLTKSLSEVEVKTSKEQDDKQVESTESELGSTQTTSSTDILQLLPSVFTNTTSARTSSILQPTMVAPKATQAIALKSNLHPFNLAEFEGASSSPFEDLELKTINDKAELALLLQPTLPKVDLTQQAPNPLHNPLPSSEPQWSYANAAEWWSTPQFQEPLSSSHTPTNPANLSLRQAKSVPDLSECSRDDDLQSTACSLGKPRVKFDDYRSTRTPPPRLHSTDDIQITSRANLLYKTQAELENPYDGLDADGRKLVRQLADMGFPEARASRLVKAYKLDEKKVLDSLLFIHAMEDKGHNLLRVEKILFLVDEPAQENVEKILAMTEQFISLGFEEDGVLKAIVDAEVDRDRALDLLLS